MNEPSTQVASLDLDTNFNAATLAAVKLGIEHVSSGTKRVRSSLLMVLVSRRLVVQLSFRRFHQEILNRAYGLAFTNSMKMKWVADRNRKSPVS